MEFAKDSPTRLRKSSSALQEKNWLAGFMTFLDKEKLRYKLKCL